MWVKNTLSHSQSECEESQVYYDHVYRVTSIMIFIGKLLSVLYVLDPVRYL